MHRFDLVTGSISTSSSAIYFHVTKTLNLIIFFLAFSVHQQALSHGVGATVPPALSLPRRMSLEKCSGSCEAYKKIILNLNHKTLGLNPWPNPTKLCMNLRGSGSEWTAYVDPASGSTYYYNSVTQETSWIMKSADDQAAELPVAEKQQADGAATAAGPSAAAAGAVQPQPTPAASAAPLSPGAASSSYTPAAAAASHVPVAAAIATGQPSPQAPLAPGHEAGGAHHAEVCSASR